MTHNHRVGKNYVQSNLPYLYNIVHLQPYFDLKTLSYSVFLMQFCFFIFLLTCNLFISVIYKHVVIIFILNINSNKKTLIRKAYQKCDVCFKMFKYIEIFFLGVTFLFCKSVNGKHIIKKTHATCYKLHNTLDK